MDTIKDTSGGALNPDPAPHGAAIAVSRYRWTLEGIIGDGDGIGGLADAGADTGEQEGSDKGEGGKFEFHLSCGICV